jgi:hypothetical protein
MQPPLPDEHWRVGWAVLSSLATSPESRQALVRAQLLPSALPLLQRVLGDRADEPRAAPVLEYCANLTFGPRR